MVPLSPLGGKSPDPEGVVPEVGGTLSCSRMLSLVLAARAWQRGLFGSANPLGLGVQLGREICNQVRLQILQQLLPNLLRLLLDEVVDGLYLWLVDPGRPLDVPNQLVVFFDDLDGRRVQSGCKQRVELVESIVCLLRDLLLLVGVLVAPLALHLLPS